MKNPTYMEVKVPEQKALTALAQKLKESATPYVESAIQLMAFLNQAVDNTLS